MKKDVEEHAERFDELAATYDESSGDEYMECLRLVVEHADPRGDDTVLDLGCGTGAVALSLAAEAGRVVGRDVSEGMLSKARQKASDRGLSNVEFGEGSFREPNYDGEATIVTSNFALHHLDDDAKRDAIDVMAGYDPRRIVLGDVMFFGHPDPEEPFYDPEVDDPATVGVLVEAFTDAGYAVTAAERVHPQVGVIVAERR
ncbi:methyltransferase domain-containing protein [Halarchaeum sp. CBA1220]|uniref:class I SAM-dependent methyltransferase n=1 Tax=Halarchaeum sp. CBA1220 TaxID=1853682 RepID=UPI000F3AA589|nr:methyltransferase domain-containing protein [Halarchaeum sp. CBA1220]QLC34628.1 methyltransferase domain-containing protein [Halarchaeum sp. CBA1220]